MCFCAYVCMCVCIYVLYVHVCIILYNVYAFSTIVCSDFESPAHVIISHLKNRSVLHSISIISTTPNIQSTCRSICANRICFSLPPSVFRIGLHISHLTLYTCQISSSYITAVCVAVCFYSSVSFLLFPYGRYALFATDVYKLGFSSAKITEQV